MPRKLPKLEEYRRLALQATVSLRPAAWTMCAKKHEKAALQWSELALLEERHRHAEAAVPTIFEAVCADLPKPRPRHECGRARAVEAIFSAGQQSRRTRCVIRDGAFFGDYHTKADAIDAAHAAARKEEAFGHEAQVFTP